MPVCPHRVLPGGSGDFCKACPPWWEEEGRMFRELSWPEMRRGEMVKAIIADANGVDLSADGARVKNVRKSAVGGWGK